MNTLLYLALLLFAGLLFGRLAKLCRLPNVTGYLIAGLLIGPYVLGLVPLTVVKEFQLISEMALGFIAFSIGNEFKLSYFKRVGMTPIVIALFEALAAVLLVTAALIVFGFPAPFSIMLGAIAAATAPAATIMVVKQYRAKGPVTETLMSVVALDDAVALIAFGFAVTVAKAMTAGVGGSDNLFLSLLSPLFEILGALVLGAGLGLVSLFPLRFFKKDGNRLIIIAGTVFLAAGLADFLGFSALLTCMAVGAMTANLCKENAALMRITDFVTPPIFLMFFVVSGAELNIGVIPTIGAVGAIYLIVRVIGKILGAWAGAKLMKAPAAVAKYLGPTLVPQAGVAIGLSLVAEAVVPEHGAVIRAVVLCATMVYELTGPVLTKLSLQRAGEIQKG